MKFEIICTKHQDSPVTGINGGMYLSVPVDDETTEWEFDTFDFVCTKAYEVDGDPEVHEFKIRIAGDLVILTDPKGPEVGFRGPAFDESI